MTTAEKILAVQTLFDKATKTVYNGSVVIDSSLARLQVANARFSVASTPTHPSEPFAVEMKFILNELPTDAIRPQDSKRLALMCSFGVVPFFGYNFSNERFEFGLGNVMTSDGTISSSYAFAIEPNKAHTIVWKVLASTKWEISFDNNTFSPSGFAPLLTSPNIYYLIFKGVNISVLSTKAYYNSGVYIGGNKGESSLNPPMWQTSDGAFTLNADPVTIKTPNATDEDLITLYLDMAAQKMLARLYPFDPTKTALDIPPIYDMTQVELAARLYARAGAEGEISHNENGINRSYKTVDDEDILSRLVPFCRTSWS